MSPANYRRKVRRSWSPERKERDRLRREKNRKRIGRYNPIRPKPADTVGCTLEEKQVLAFVSFSPGKRAPYWMMLNKLAGEGPESEKRPRRQFFMALVGRLLRERKLVRIRPANILQLREPPLGEPVKVQPVSPTVAPARPKAGDGFVAF